LTKTEELGALTAPYGVSLAVRAGEVAALTGENSAGMTTMTRAIAPSAGGLSGWAAVQLTEDFRPSMSNV
jgi:ABC-type uncharacterized transport system ATPase subunit